ncbi:MAG: 30S ribosomal protein S6 [Gaiellaceae bacterium]
MTDYEILLMLDPELPEERQNEIVSRIREAVERDGRWEGNEPWGRRRLAYEIDHKPEGTYHLLLFETEPATLDEISRVLKITDGVMRHLAVRRVQGGTTRPPEPIREEPRREEPRREEPSHEEASHEEASNEEPSHEEPVAAAVPASQDSEPEPEPEPESPPES